MFYFIFQLKNVRERLAKNLTEKGVLTTEKQVKIKYSNFINDFKRYILSFFVLSTLENNNIHTLAIKGL